MRKISLPTGPVVFDLPATFLTLMGMKTQYEFLRGSVSGEELELWNRLSQHDLSVLDKIYDLNAHIYFMFIIGKIKSREKAMCILLASFHAMLERKGELSGIELSKFLFDTVVDFTTNFCSIKRNYKSFST